MYAIFDIEANGLLDSVTKIHCLSYRILDEQYNDVSYGHYTDAFNIINFFFQDYIYVGHNIIRYDIPVIEKLYGVDLSKIQLIDTLGLSWYLYVEREKHGLAQYGEIFKVPKPVIEDWNNLSIEDYLNRCDTDVVINSFLFVDEMNFLNELYDDPQHIISYLNFKLDCLREQEHYGIKLDTRRCEETLNNFEFILQEKIDKLSNAMPKDLGVVLKKKPDNLYKKDGSLSQRGINWFLELEKRGLPDSVEEIREAPNPGSNDQLKEWLLRLGWKPITFKESKATGEKVPQVNIPGQGLCPSVKELFPICPILEELDSYFTIRHRIGILKSFLECKDDRDMIYASANGFTRTLRMKHAKPLVNLPKITKAYAADIRTCLTVPDDSYIMCGSDVSSLEDNTKQHFIYVFDPEYVKEMRVPGFDPHLDIAIKGELMTEEQGKLFKELKHKEHLNDEEKELFLQLSSIRSIAKNGNFAMTYNAMPPKIAETIKKPLAVAKKLYDTYWERNKAIKQVADSLAVKVVRQRKWLYNPVNHFWLSLKTDKDKFSALNQNTGCFFFDVWLKNTRKLLKKRNIPVVLQYHDELLTYCKKEDQEFVSDCLSKAIKKANEDIKLNVEIGISMDWGQNYGDCH